MSPSIIRGAKNRVKCYTKVIAMCFSYYKMSNEVLDKSHY